MEKSIAGGRSDWKRYNIGERDSGEMKVLILTNYDAGLYRFRKELLESLLEEKHSVFIAAPGGEKMDEMIQMGCKAFQVEVDRRGMNPFRDLNLLKVYLKLMRKTQPDVVLTYTVKPNIYGGAAARLNKIPYISNITGLGPAFREKGAVQKILIILSRIALKDAVIFFQNKENRDFFKKSKIRGKKEHVIPGSGVNLKEFYYMPYPHEKTFRFVFIARIMREKGIEEFLNAAKVIKEKGLDAQFDICGFFEEEKYKIIIEEYQKKGIVVYHGLVENMREIYSNCHCVIISSYREGLSNVILEAASCGRPSIVSNIPGCREAVEDEKTGLLVKVRDAGDLVLKIEQFINLSAAKRKEMGQRAREKVEREFNRENVVRKYMEEILQSGKG